MPVTEQTYQCVALEDPDGKWELHRGRLREKPGMTFAHNRSIDVLAAQVYRQIDVDRFAVRINMGHIRRSDETYYIPDLFIAPLGLPNQDWSRSDVLEVYGEPILLVVEVWSPSTGGYDVDARLPEYQRRGDLEIWRIQPYERALIARRRRPDGTYAESMHRRGTIRPIAMPGISVDLDELFRL